MHWEVDTNLVLSRFYQQRAGRETPCRRGAFVPHREGPIVL
jgi:hypothetical protein